MDTTNDLSILVIDDEPETATLLGMLLKHKISAKYDIASDCKTAREKLSKSSYDLITLDFQLPDCDGLTFLREVLSMKEPPPVVMVTGQGDEKTAVEAFRLGASGYVVKDTRLNVMFVEEVKAALMKREFLKSELALRSVSNTLNNIYDLAIEGIIVSGADKRAKFANAQAVEMFGYDDMEDLIRTSPEIYYVDPGVRDEMYPYLIKNGYVRDFNVEVKRKDGSTFWARLNSSVQLDEKGNLISGITFFADVTKQREAEAALRESEARLREIYDSAVEGIAVTDANGMFEYVNPKFAQMCGFDDPGEMIGSRTIERFVDPDERRELLDALDDQGDLNGYEFHLKRRDGSSIWILGNISIQRDENGDPFRRISFFTDINDKKIAEESLKESEERLRNIYEASIEGIAATNADGVLEFANPRFAELYGFSSPEEMTGISIADLYADPGERGEVIQGMDESGIIQGREIEFKRKDGSSFWGSVNVVQRRDEDGNVVRNEGFVLDVTQRKEAEAELRNSEAALREIYDTALEGIVVSNADGKFEYVNPKFAQLFGYDSPEEMIGVSTINAYVDPKTRENILEILNEKGYVENFETEYIRRDGSTFWGRVNLVLHRDSDSGYFRVVGFVVDITESKQMLEKLAEKEETLLEVYESSIEGIGIGDADGRFVMVNPRIAELFGFDSPDEMVGTFIKDRYVDTGRREELFKVLSEKGFVEGFEAEMERKDGSRFWASLNVVLHSSENSDTRWTSGFIMDITERKKAEEELLRVNRELEAFAHTVSHNLKGPLASVSLAADLLKAELGKTKNEQVLQLLENIERNVLKGQERISSMLWLAESGQKPIDVETIDMGVLIEEILDELNTGDAKIIADEELGRISANRQQVHQIFSNLISNAIRHNTCSEPEVHISYVGDLGNGVHEYMVCDNGPGIPESIMDKIFVPFGKGGNTGQTGLGLYIAKKIANVYDGDIRVCNDNGACFRVTLRDHEI